MAVTHDHRLTALAELIGLLPLDDGARGEQIRDLRVVVSDLAEDFGRVLAEYGRYADVGQGTCGEEQRRSHPAHR